LTVITKSLVLGNLSIVILCPLHYMTQKMFNILFCRNWSNVLPDKKQSWLSWIFMSDLQSKRCPGLDPSSVCEYVESAVFFD